MAILKIARMGHPVLRRPAAPIEDPTAPEVQRLIADMYETMLDAVGAGLAANQVHVAKRLVHFWIVVIPVVKCSVVHTCGVRSRRSRAFGGWGGCAPM